MEHSKMTDFANEKQYLSNNRIMVCGIMEKAPVFSHETHNERFYSAEVLCKRTSGTIDRIPISIPEKILAGTKFSNNMEAFCEGKIMFEGQLRVANKRIENGVLHQRSQLYLHPTFVAQAENTADDFNAVEITGLLRPKATHRMTPFGREIADYKIAIARRNGRIDYIPCIGWGRNAQYIASLEPHCSVKVVGRLQSRIYTKIFDDEQSASFTTYEVSTDKILVEVGEKA